MNAFQTLVAGLAAAPDKYDGGDIETAREGLKVYNAFIQNDIVTPGLLESNSYDVAQPDDITPNGQGYFTIGASLGARNIGQSNCSRTVVAGRFSTPYSDG